MRQFSLGDHLSWGVQILEEQAKAREFLLSPIANVSRGNPFTHVMAGLDYVTGSHGRSIPPPKLHDVMEAMRNSQVLAHDIPETLAVLKERMKVYAKSSGLPMKDLRVDLRDPSV